MAKLLLISSLRLSSHQWRGPKWGSEACEVCSERLVANCLQVHWASRFELDSTMWNLNQKQERKLNGVFTFWKFMTWLVLQKFYFCPTFLPFFQMKVGSSCRHGFSSEGQNFDLQWPSSKRQTLVVLYCIVRWLALEPDCHSLLTFCATFCSSCSSLVLNTLASIWSQKVKFSHTITFFVFLFPLIFFFFTSQAIW